jgi:hypothetical protein
MLMTECPAPSNLLLSCIEDAGTIPRGTCRLIHIPKPRIVNDAVNSFLLLDANDCPIGVAQWSDASAPRLLQRAVDSSVSVRQLLGLALSDFVIEPMCSGDADGRTFAVWPWRRPIPQRGLAWWLRRPGIRRSVRDWLRGVVRVAAAAERTENVRLRYRETLTYVCHSVDFSPQQKTVAELAVARLDSGKWRPASIVDHNDLWRGNVHWNVDPQGRQCGTAPLVIIDWGGANPLGSGYYDLMRWAASTQMSVQDLASEVRLYADILGVDPIDAKGHLLCTLGRLAIHREQLQVERLRQLVRSMWDRFERATA